MALVRDAVGRSVLSESFLTGLRSFIQTGDSRSSASGHSTHSTRRLGAPLRDRLCAYPVLPFGDGAHQGYRAALHLAEGINDERGKRPEIFDIGASRNQDDYREIERRGVLLV